MMFFFSTQEQRQQATQEQRQQARLPLLILTPVSICLKTSSIYIKYPRVLVKIKCPTVNAKD